MIPAAPEKQAVRRGVQKSAVRGGLHFFDALLSYRGNLLPDPFRQGRWQEMVQRENVREEMVYGCADFRASRLYGTP